MFKFGDFWWIGVCFGDVVNNVVGVDGNLFIVNEIGDGDVNGVVVDDVVCN